MSNNDDAQLTPEAFISEISLSRPVRFWLLLLFEVPSLFCSLFVMHEFIMDSNLRSSLYHHAIFAVNIFAFIIKLIDVPLYLHFTVQGGVSPATPATCLIWWIVNIGCYGACCLLAAWASIERHIFVFHDQWLSTRLRRICIHYFPLLVIILYASVYYIRMIVFPSCENMYIYGLPICGAVPCYQTDPILGRWESGVHGCSMTIIVALFSISLPIRLLLTKRRCQQVMQWRKYRKMSIQILLISSIFLIFNLPLTIVALMQLVGVGIDIASILTPYFFFSTYWLIFLIPWVCLGSLPNLQRRVRRILHISPRRQAIVAIALIARPTDSCHREPVPDG